MSTHQMHSRASAAYRNAAETHSPAWRIMMLHNGAIQRLNEARTAIAEQRVEDRYHLVMKAHAIVSALQCCLDFEQGGDIAPLLDRFYSYIINRMFLLNVRNDPAICDELVMLLGQLRDGWHEVGLLTAPALVSPSAISSGQTSPAPTI